MHRTGRVKKWKSKYYLDNKEQKTIFPVVSRSGELSSFIHPFFASQVERASKFPRPENRLDESNLPRPFQGILSFNSAGVMMEIKEGSQIPVTT